MVLMQNNHNFLIHSTTGKFGERGDLHTLHGFIQQRGNKSKKGIQGLCDLDYQQNC